MVNTRMTFLGILGSAFLLCDFTNAATFVLTPTQDVYLNATNSGNRNLNFNGQNIYVASSPSSGRAGLVQYDLSSLSGLTITNAYLRVFQFDTTGTTTAFTSDAYFLDYANGSGGFDETAATWNDYGSPDLESLTAGFGVLSIPISSPAGQYYDSVHASGSASDLAYIQGRIDQPNAVDQIIALQLWRQSASSGSRLFGDKESLFADDNSTHPVQLVIESVPEPSSVILSMSGITIVAVVRRRRSQSLRSFASR